MKILVITPEQLPIPPIEGGSVETCTYNIFRRMAGSDSITMLTRAHARLPAVSRSNQGRLRIIRIASGNRMQYIQAGLNKVRNMRFDVIQIENRPTFVPYVRKVFPRTPIMLSLHSLTFMSKLSKKQADSILRQVNGVVSVVDFVTRTMKRRYPAHARKFRTAILGVDTSKFSPKSKNYKLRLRRRWGVAGSFNVLFVGRIVRKKGLHTLTKAVSQLKRRHKKISLIAVGASWPGVTKETRYMRKVRLMSKRLRVPIRFTGYIPPARVHRMYHLGDVFVCPTQYREGFATVNSEAMSSGIPVIASRRGGIPEVIKHNKNGLLVSRYTSASAFAKAIERVKRSPSLARRLSIQGRKSVRAKLSWYSTVRKLKAHYRGMIKR